HVAVALAAVGNPDRALDALAFFRTVPRRAGLFEARYLLDGSGSPDQRTPQFDGLGWTLWALGRIHANGSTAVRQRIVDDFGDLAADLAGTICEQIDANDGLPPTSPDYWEHEESSLTLGTVAPTLAGLMSTGPLWHDLGATRLGERVAATAGHLEATTVQYFGSTGYQRYASGGGPDAATAFLVGPYVDQFAHGAVVPLLSEAEERMRRPAGGLAPGARWKRDGISWTPQTSLFAMAYAHTGQDDRAHRLLRWLDRHRTAAGSLPEKVLHDGTPSAVAPLAWTAANVVLAVAALR